jgi:hypothetical protein
LTKGASLYLVAESLSGDASFEFETMFDGEHDLGSQIIRIYDLGMPGKYFCD